MLSVATFPFFRAFFPVSVNTPQYLILFPLTWSLSSTLSPRGKKKKPKFPSLFPGQHHPTPAHPVPDRFYQTCNAFLGTLSGASRLGSSWDSVSSPPLRLGIYLQATLSPSQPRLSHSILLPSAQGRQPSAHYSLQQKLLAWGMYPLLKS